MTSLDHQPAPDIRAARTIVRLAVASFVVLAAAATLLWARFGPLIFLDMLTTLQNCL